MADEEVERILKDLELHHLIPIFKDQKVSMIVLKIISEQLIVDIIPDAGSKAIFLDYWKKNIKFNENDEIPAKKTKTDCDPIILENIPVSTSNDSVLFLDKIFETPGGKNILDMYNIYNKKLPDKLQSKLVDLILDELESKKITLDNSLSCTITEWIVNKFSSEVGKTYFTPPIKKKDSVQNKSEPASGKLLTQWRNRLARRRKLEKTLRAEVEYASQNNCADDEKEGFAITEDLKTIKTWLHINRVPWKSVQENWAKTFALRQHELQHLKDSNLSNFLKSWDLLLLPNGHELILQDFNSINTSATKLNFDVWIKFMELLFAEKKLNEKDTTAEKLKGIYDKQTDKRSRQAGSTSKNKSEDLQQMLENTKVAASLMLLSHMFPPRGVLKFTKTSSYKSSIASSKESIVRHIENAGKMDDVKLEAQEHAGMVGQTLQPYILIVGPIEEIQEIYVILDNATYKTNTVLEAIDVCFKIFQVFSLRYPFDSIHLWQLVQRGIYKIHTKYDRTISYMQKVYEKIEKEAFVEEDVTDTASTTSENNLDNEAESN